MSKNDSPPRRSKLKRAARGLIVVVALLVVVLVANTYRKPSRQIAVANVQSAAVDVHAAVERLAGGLRFRTIAYDDEAKAATSGEELRKLHAYLEQQFPKAHAAMKKELVGELSLLFTWPGTDPTARPILLMAHQDVVPIAPGTEKDWQAEPFAGTVRDGFIWGRGAWDDKGNLFAMLEAVEMLATQGFKPRRTVYFAFGHDEETGGEHGAKQIAALLKSRSVKAEFALDEGLLITEGVMRGLARPLALIGVAEKGYLNVTITAKAAPGHSSMPPRETAIGTLSAALVQLERNPMPAAVRGVVTEMLDTVAPEMPGMSRVSLSNRWLFGGAITRQLEETASTNAMLRTTTALTIVNGGNKANVLPGSAEANVNFRLLPGDSQDDVLAHAKLVIANDAVTVERAAGFNVDASPISATDSASFQLLQRTVRELFPGTLVAPGLLIGGTDSRHMVGIAENVFRFSPVRAHPEDLPRFHGTNERISLTNYAELIAFYHRLLSVG